jgi:PleD family two-component response regulator
VEKPRILIVEDDLDLSEMLSAYFRVQNYEVLTAAWGEEAVKTALSEPLNLIVLDIRLPDIDGYEVCRQLRNQRQTQDLPIVFLTEKRDRVDKLQGLELGVVDYITKPFDIQELRLRVRNAINRAMHQSLINPVTEIPEGNLVEEKINQVLYSDEDWGVLLLSIHSLKAFRDTYGFVAADDVLRAVALMIRNAVREFGGESDFIGHKDSESFVVLTNQKAIKQIISRLDARVQQSREYFYPVRDRDRIRESSDPNLLGLNFSAVSAADGPFNTVEALYTALQKVSTR